MIIGMSGPSGAGKSSVCKYLSRKGFKIINVDEVAKSLYETDGPAYHALVAVFGDKILLDNGKVNRRYLGQIVFKNKGKMEQLNKVMMPHIYLEIKRIIREEKNKFLVLDASFLVKTKLYKLVDLSIIIDADKKTRIQRLIGRGVNRDIAEQMASAVKLTKEDISRSHLILYNNNEGDLAKIRKELEIFLIKYHKLTK